MAELQEKISALEAQTVASQASQPREVKPCRSARETKGQKKAKLKAMVQDLMDRFAALESKQVPDAPTTHDVDMASSTPRSCSTEKGRRSSTPGVSESASAYQEGQDVVEEVCLDNPFLEEEPCRATTSSGESAIAPGSHMLLPAWPWVSGSPYSYTAYTPYLTCRQGPGLMSLQVL